jgi:hypothetical protein
MPETVKDRITNILGQIESLDLKMGEPPTKLRRSDRELAVIKDDFLKKLFLLGMLERREESRTRSDAGYESDDDSQLELTRRTAEHESLADALMALFWHLVRAQYELWEVGSIGVRKGWVVVQSECENPLAHLQRFGW